MREINVNKMNKQQKTKALFLWRSNDYSALKKLLIETGVIFDICELHCTDEMLDKHMRFWVINKDL